MKRRLTIGAIICLGLGMLIGTMSGLFPGLGDGDTMTGVVGTNEHSAPVEKTPEKEPSKMVLISQTPAEVLTVRIEERNYSIREMSEEGETFRRVELSELIDLAKQTKGDSDGLRVQIIRDVSARATAENALYEELEKAGLGKNAIQSRDDFTQ